MYFPPNFVGLKISDCTVAIPTDSVSLIHYSWILYAYFESLVAQRASVKRLAEGTEKAICGQRSLLLNAILKGGSTCDAFVELRDSIVKVV